MSENVLISDIVYYFTLTDFYYIYCQRIKTRYDIFFFLFVTLQWQRQCRTYTFFRTIFQCDATLMQDGHFLDEI